MAVLGVSLVELSLPGQRIVAVLVVSFVELSLSGQRIVAGFARLSGLFETAATVAGVVSVAVAAPGVVSVAAPASAVVYAYKVAAAAVVVVAGDHHHPSSPYSVRWTARRCLSGRCWRSCPGLPNRQDQRGRRRKGL